MRHKFFIGIAVVFSALIFINSISAQTSGFVYQGKLNDGSSAANGTYQFEFKLYDANGIQVGNTISNLPATVTGGIFAVTLDFGAGAFDGTARLLEIGVRANCTVNCGNVPFITLTPRQAVTSTPYAIRSLNANQATTANNSLNLGGIAANQYVLTTDPRMSDDRDPLPGSGNYIQNTSNPQANSNFNVSGSGTVGGTLKGNIVNATTQYNFNNQRVLHLTGTENTFLGIFTGNVTTGGFNSFFGSEAGKVNTTGFNNSFVGAYAGRANLGGANNSFTGANAGLSNTSGSSNSFFGSNAGFSNTSGNYNSFFGNGAGQANNTGLFNSFFGYQAGFNTTPNPNLGVINASYNAFFGYQAGYGNTSGYYNTFVGSEAGKTNSTGTSNSFFGYNAGESNLTACCNSFFGSSAGSANTIGKSNTFIGQLSGRFNTEGDSNTFVGQRAGYGNILSSNNTFVGTDAGLDSTGGGNTFLGAFAGDINKTGTGNTFVGVNSGTQSSDTFNNTFIGSGSGFFVIDGNNNTMIGSGASSETGFLNLSYATAIGAGAAVSTSNTIALGRSNGSDKVVVYGLGAAGSTHLCINAAEQISTCSSSLRYKENVQNFTGGLDVVNRLRPVTFAWKADGSQDVGFVAEEINSVEPLLSTYNKQGEIEGVKYAQVTTVLVNAVKQQQAQIEKQDEQIKQQQAQIEALKVLVCQSNPNAAVCQK